MMKRTDTIIIILCILLFAFLSSCGSQKKISSIREADLAASLELAKKESDSEIPELAQLKITRDTLTVHDEDGKEILIMKAIKDDETGEMVATETLDAAKVTARFRNVAERHGKVDLVFQIIVPESMQDSKWQLRFYPDLFILNDSTRIDSVIVTGNGYRKSQLRGFQQYQKFMNKMMSDSSMFANYKALEIFLKRNIPQIYQFRNDTSFVSDEEFYSEFGVSEQEAINHYNRRAAMKNKMYTKYLKQQIVTEGIKLDTVMQSINGDFIYEYVQTINTRPKLRKADIVLSGAIFQQGEKLYTMPRSEPLTFYISSISAFTDNSVHYLKKVIERRAEGNTACRIDFESGKTAIKPELNQNQAEISKIKKTLGDLIENEVFDLDSITVIAAASPEGSIATNSSLSQGRSVAVSNYFNTFVKHYLDSLKKDEGIMINMDETMASPVNSRSSIKFTPRSIAENWDDLDLLVREDTVLNSRQKESYSNTVRKYAKLDERENQLKHTDYYQYLKNELYPKLRTVKFNFYMHRRGMVKDTIHTSVVDTLYAEGVQLLKDMDYAAALEIFRDYNDYNTAICYVGLNRNQNAIRILEKLPKEPEVNYMLAVLYSRLGDAQKAVDFYLRSCKQNPSFVYRGNLDPEISVLIKTYGLNQEPEDDFSF